MRACLRLRRTQTDPLGVLGSTPHLGLRALNARATKHESSMASSFVNLFSGGSGSGAGSQGTGGGSLLNDWNSYSAANTAEAADLEGGGSFTKSMETAKNLFSAGTSSLSRAATAATGLGASTTTFMPSRQQWAYFAGFLAAGLFFLSLSLFVMLPMLVIAPAKFATSFTVGCICIMASFFALR